MKKDSPVEREAKRLLPELFSLVASDLDSSMRVRTQTRQPDTAAWKCATIKAHPSRVFRPALRRAFVRWYADDDTLSGSGRFRTPVSYIAARREPTGSHPRKSSRDRFETHQPALSRPFFIAAGIYERSLSPPRKEERGVLPTVLLMDTFRPPRLTPRKKYSPRQILLIVFFFYICLIGKYTDNYNAKDEAQPVHSPVKSNHNCLHLYKPFKFCMKIVAGWVRQQYRFKNHLECMRCPC